MCAEDQLFEMQDIRIPDYDGNESPMMVFVNISYTFDKCFSESDCYGAVEILVRLSTNQHYLDSESILPSNEIVLSPHSSTSTGLKHVHFIVEGGFSLQLKSHPSMDKCLMVSRVLVYQGMYIAL